MIFNQKLTNGKNWIEWVHHFTFDLKALPYWAREIIYSVIVTIMQINNHCSLCSRLSGCLFVESKMPEMPLHERCHCVKLEADKPIPNETCLADMDDRKFLNYIFSQNSNGKKELFTIMGYTREDTNFLIETYCQQAMIQYSKGNYELGALDVFGQRINVTINLNGYKIKSGWMLEPKGILRNLTPFGGWVNEN